MKSTAGVARVVLGRLFLVLGISYVFGPFSLLVFVPWMTDEGLTHASPFAWLMLAAGLAQLAAMGIAAVWLLQRARRAGGAAPSSARDLPARLLAVASATLPESRRDWGAAMRAELAQVQTRSARWQFAAGCAWTAIFPPRGNRGAVAAAAALGAVLAVVLAGFAVGEAFAPMRVFAMAFIGLIGAAAVFAVTRSRPVSRPTSGPLILVAGATSVASCIAATAYLIDQYPAAAYYLRPVTAIILAVPLAGVLWLILVPPRALTTDRWAPRIAVGVTLALALGLLLVSRWDLTTGGDSSKIGGFVGFVPAPAIFVTAFVAAAVRQSVRAGLQVAVWTALLASLAAYAITVHEAVLWYQVNQTLIRDGEITAQSRLVGAAIHDSTWGLIPTLCVWVIWGVMGAAIGRASRARLSRTRSQPRQAGQVHQLRRPPSTTSA